TQAGGEVGELLVRLRPSLNPSGESTHGRPWRKPHNGISNSRQYWIGRLGEVTRRAGVLHDPRSSFEPYVVVSRKHRAKVTRARVTNQQCEGRSVLDALSRALPEVWCHCMGCVTK